MSLRIERAEPGTHLTALAAFIDREHSYIRYADRPSRKLYWSVYERDGTGMERRVGAFGLGSAYHRPAAIAAFMQKHSIPFNGLANNIVFALAGVTTPNAGTRALALLRRDAVRRWQDEYGDRLRAFQTFILPPRTGAVYLADNWVRLG